MEIRYVIVIDEYLQATLLHHIGDADNVQNHIGHRHNGCNARDNLAHRT